LRAWQAERLALRRKAGEKRPLPVHRTFQSPKRRQDILDGGSLYWVIKGLIQVRQPIADIQEGCKDDGTPCCLLVLRDELIGVRPTPRRPFQGWRYLDPAEAPHDLKGPAADGVAAMPAKL